jgi:5-bromo-4-chloroindolyl phosphate hydrolysis protein
MSRKAAGNVLAAIVAIIVGSFFLLALGTFWVWAVLAAAAGYGLTLLIIPGLPRREADQLPPGLTKETVAQAIAEAEAAVDRLRVMSRRVGDPGVRMKALKACATAGKIVDELRRDPKNILGARQFLSYYLDATGRIVTRYVEITARKSSGPSVQAALDRVEPTLETIDQAFERQLESLLNDDVLDLDAEMSLLQKTAKMDGLIDELGAVAPRAAALPLPDAPGLPTSNDGAAEPPPDAAGARKGAGDEEEAARR